MYLHLSTKDCWLNVLSFIYEKILMCLPCYSIKGHNFDSVLSGMFVSSTIELRYRFAFDQDFLAI